MDFGYPEPETPSRQGYRVRVLLLQIAQVLHVRGPLEHRLRRCEKASTAVLAEHHQAVVLPAGCLTLNPTPH